MKFSKLVFVLTTIGVLVASSDSSVMAGSATANLSVTATVSANCTISTTAVAFPAYDPIVANLSANDDGTGSVIVTCTRGTAATIGLGLGANASGSQMRMKDAATDYLNYALYQDAGRATVWGNSGAGLLSPAAAPDKNPRTFTVYGRIPSAQDVPAGSYTDTVVATVNF
ncbi:MAG: spore coat U domain-containing protein [Polyangia bacterium]